jgi:hypothetical protein
MVSARPSQWQKKIDNARDVLKDELWQCFLDTGLSIDKAEAVMVMMKSGMFYSANGQSQADQLKAMVDSLKEQIGRSCPADYRSLIRRYRVETPAAN